MTTSQVTLLHTTRPISRSRINTMAPVTTRCLYILDISQLEKPMIWVGDALKHKKIHTVISSSLMCLMPCLLKNRQHSTVSKPSVVTALIFEWCNLNRTVFRAFSICSRCVRRFIRMSAPWFSVSKAIRWDACNRLVPSSSWVVPANSRARSLFVPYGSSEDVKGCEEDESKSERVTWARCSFRSFLYRAKSAFAVSNREWYSARTEWGIPCISSSICET